jgi:DNA modification methylase
MKNRSLLSRLSNVDWDFAGKASESPFSSIHFHPCRFASQLPATLIGLLSSAGDLAVDPFVGSGSTMVEAQRLGRKSIGVDLNPIAVNTASAKCLNVPATTVVRAVGVLKDRAMDEVSRQLKTNRSLRKPVVPASVQAAKWYVPAVAHDLGLLWSMILALTSSEKVIAELAFSAILLTVCRETRHWGYVCDNTAPKSQRGGDVCREFIRVLEKIEQAYLERDAELNAAGREEPLARAVAICGDAVEELAKMPSKSVDLFVTSPPYFGVCDYVKAQRLSMEWFGLDIEPLRKREIGARSKRHRTSAQEDYLIEFEKVLGQMRRCLKRGRYAALILGESGTRLGVLSAVRTSFERVGFKCLLEQNRTVSSQRRMTPSILGEHLFLLRGDL